MAGVSLQVVHYGLRFFATPLVIGAVGLEAYGFWAILFQILGLLGLHRIGLLSASVTFVAQAVAEERSDRVGAIVRSTATLNLLLAGTVTVIVFCLQEPLVRLLGVPTDHLPGALTALRWTVASTALALVFGGYQSVLEGLQLHPRVRLVEGGASLLEITLLLALFQLGYGLPALGFAYALRVLAPLPVYAWLARRRLPGLRAGPLGWERSELRRLVRFGGAIQASGLLHLTVATLDRLALAHLVSLYAAGAVELARKLIQLATSLPLQACAPLVPATAGNGRTNKASGSALVESAQRLVVCCSAPLLVLLVAIPSPLLGVWIGDVPAGAPLALQLLSIGAFVHLCTGPLTSQLRGHARGKDELGYMLIWVLAAAVGLPTGAWLGGFRGVLVASLAAQSLAALSLLARSQRLIGVAPARLARLSLTPLLCCLPAGLWIANAELGGESRMALLADLAIHGIPFALMTLLPLWLFGLSHEERRAISRLAHLSTRWVRPAQTTHVPSQPESTP